MASRANIRLITYSNELVNGETVYISSNCLPIKASHFEPAGHSFHDVALKLRGYFEDEIASDYNDNFSKDKETEYMQSSDSYSSKGKKKSGGKTAQQDHYALLGLGHLRYLATEEQIRKGYRETALKHQPDKQAALLLGEETEAAKQAKKDEIENRFKAIQEAYEILMDPTRRRIYDSTDEFDDEIPTDCSTHDFYKVFGTAFMRNGRWSVSQPIPSLGDDNTPLKEVDAFYDFWFGFKSWREFPHEDEFDLEQAESRDHKRWMERQNAKLSEKARKEEHARIRSLVDNAYKWDPRILKRKETLKAEKQKKKEAKFMAKKLQKEEAARVAEENRKKKEKQAAEFASNQKKIKEKEKKLLRKERTRLRTVSTTVVSDSLFNLTQDDIENLCVSLDMLQLKNLCDNLEQIEGDSQSQAELLLKHAMTSGHIEKDGVANNNSQQNGSAKVKVNGSVLKSNIEKKEKPWGKDEKSEYMQSSDSYSSKGKKKSGGKTAQQDHYALLGLGHLRYLATEEHIRKSYRETALKHQPDKQAALLLGEETEAAKQAKKDEIENRFKAIQEAYEILMDPTRRRIYDSTDEFDDEIPTDCSTHDFYKVFGTAFMRNGRWSVSQPIPSLGDDNTPLKEVDAFYDFWFGFKSWREFPHEDEFDLEQAESRDHKRWMERQNAKLSEKARKEEHARIRSLVDNAYKRDPRILKRKETLKAEKQKKKEAKFMAKKLQKEEAARVAEENRKKKEKQAAEFASNQKKIKEKEKKLLCKERTRLRTVSTTVVSDSLFNLTQDDIENLCVSLDMLQLKNLCDNLEQIEGDSQSQAELLLKHAMTSGHIEKDGVANNNSQQNGSAKVKVNGSVLKSNIEKKEKPWGKEEIELLRKGIVKYPKGTSRRWKVISEYIGTGRSVEEILKATKTVLLQKPDSAKAFDSFLEKRKPSVIISTALTTREDVVGASSTSTPTQPEPSQGAEKVEPVGSSSDQDVWSAVQETALVQALKTFPKEANQRWERVAAAVPGKTVKQCKKQFALLKEKFRSKKR